MGYSAFQSNAFQNNAFQIIASGGVAPVVPVEHYSGGYETKKRRVEYLHEPLKQRQEYLRSRIESFPEPVQEVLEQAINIDNKKEREDLLTRELASHNKFLRVYLNLLEEYYLILLDVQLAEELAKVEKARQDEDDLLILLLMSV